MGRIKLKGKHLRSVDFPSDIAKSQAIITVEKHYKHLSLDEKIQLITDVLSTPEAYSEHDHFYNLANLLTKKPEENTKYAFHPLIKQGEFEIFGERYIGKNAVLQMEAAMKLPVSVKGALMPDAHQGYGLPIGGVLAAKNAVIPYGVGMDIGCRMALSIFDAPVEFLEHKAHTIQKALKKYTHFGNEGTLDLDVHHDVLDRQEFQYTPLLKRLQNKAWYQLGTSGTGNHFVEFGIVQLEEQNILGLPAGSYTSLLSHSGSRGMGAQIASAYTRIAREKCVLPKELQSMAWLDMNDEAGQEYWIAMNLAGDYAAACHDVIHENLQKALGLHSLFKVQNHHNFAWKELHNGEELIVHRKGATPASKGELGIIPGSMTSKGYIVSGLGHEGSINSASHGAGRKLSRKQARESITKSSLNELLAANKVELIGGSVEEAAFAYKDIEAVIQSQEQLVKIEGTFTPKIVRMNKS